MVPGMVAGADSIDDMDLLAGADQVAYLDIDDPIKATYAYQKQGAGYGYSGVKGLNALLAIVSPRRRRR